MGRQKRNRKGGGLLIFRIARAISFSELLCLHAMSQLPKSVLLMTNSNHNIAWGQVILSALVTALLSLVGAIAFYHYTKTAPDLVYEVFPPAHFTTQETQISIYSARVENAGNKEAEDVQVYFEFPSSANIQDMKIEPNLTSIGYTVSQPEIANNREISFPRLNQQENVRFLILVDKGEAAQLKVEVRGKGVTGHTDRKEESSIFLAIASGTAGMLIALIATFAVGLTRQFSEGRLGQLFYSQKSLLDQELRLVRTREKTPEVNLKEILLSKRYRLYFNPRVPGLSKTKVMRFGNEGAILEGRNKNESSWRIRRKGSLAPKRYCDYCLS